MKQYLNLAKKAMDTGIRKKNRTGVDHIGYTGDMMKFDLSKGFPAVTTKKLAIKSVIAEMLGFLRGYRYASDFRALGCMVWDANANENEQWLANPNRKMVDDLGGVYGVQARAWESIRYASCQKELDALLARGYTLVGEPTKFDNYYDEKYCIVENDTGNRVISAYCENIIDQLKMVVDDLSKGIDNRREIVTHWNPGQMDNMALPPCHMFYQFGIQGDRLNLSMYQRSCDVPLGIPFNIAGYAWLLSVIAQITGLKAGEFTHFMHDIHIYENQMELMREQVTREPKQLPKLLINPEIRTLEDLETWVTPDNFSLVDYEHHPHIKYPFAV